MFKLVLEKPFVVTKATGIEESAIQLIRTFSNWLNSLKLAKSENEGVLALKKIFASNDITGTAFRSAVAPFVPDFEGRTNAVVSELAIAKYKRMLCRH